MDGVEVFETVMRKVPLYDIVQSDFNPRSVFEQTEIDELAESIGTVGVLQPVLLRPHPCQGGKYEIVNGERRVRAAQQAGLDDIPAIIEETSDEDAALAALVENVTRVDLNPIDLARGLQTMKQRFGWTEAHIGAAIHKS